MRHHHNALLLLAVLLSATASVRAEYPVVVSPTIANAGGAIPGNGGVLIQAGPSAPKVSVTASGGAVVKGTLQARGDDLGPRGHYWVWMPATPLEPGTYAFTMEAESVVVTDVVIGASVTTQRPELEAAPVLIYSDWGALDNARCRDEAGNSDLQLPGFDVRLNVVFLETHLSTSASPAQLGQFLFRARPTVVTPGGSGTLFQPLAAPEGLTFTRALPEYCFEIDALDIVTGEVTTYEAFSPDCVAHTALGDVPPVGYEYDAAHFALLELPGCPAPPLWHEDTWCSVNKAACEAPSAPATCGTYCTSPSTPEAMATAADADAAVMVSAADAAIPAATEPDAGSPQSEVRSDAGTGPQPPGAANSCSVSAPGATTSSHGLWLGCLLGFVYGLYARRVSASRRNRFENRSRLQD